MGLTALLAACGSSSSESDTGGGDKSAGQTTGKVDIPDVEFVGWESKVPDCYEEASAEDLTIGYSSPTSANEGTQMFIKVIEAETNALGGTAIVEDAQLEPDKQVSDVQRLVAAKVDALIVSPIDPKALRPVLEQARNAGIPVVGLATAEVEKPLAPPEYATQVSASTGEAGYVEAKKMAELVPSGSEVGQVNLSVPVPSIEYLISEAKHYAEEFGLKPVALQSNPTDDIAGGETAVSGLLGEAPNIAGVMAYNDESATGGYAAARAQGKDIPMVSMNGGSLAYTGVESGAIEGSAQLQYVQMGECAVQGAYDLAQGKTVPKAVAPGEVALIDKETISEVPTWDERLAEIPEG